MLALRRLALTLALAAAAPAHAQAPPPVLVIATGGTISNTGGDRRTGDELVRGLPGAGRVASVTVEQFLNTASGAITLEQWQALSARIEEAFRTNPALAGVVVTHGTDTMEETAYFLSLTVSDCRPVVVTGAMRRADAAGADGPANLYNALRVAVDPRARRLGAVVLMNDHVFAAREVSKQDASRVDAFAAPGSGPVGVADPDTVAWLRNPVSPRCARPAFPLSGLRALPRVDVVYSYQGADGALIRAAVEAGARGVVVAGVGRGGTTPGQSRAITDAIARGVMVVVGTRTGSGRVPVGGPEQLRDWRPGQGARLGAGDLNPHKARILLMLALTRTRDAREIREMFERY